MPRMGLDISVILLRAAEFVNEKGLDGISLGELAKQLNIRTPSLYNHIDSLAALKQKLAIYSLNRLYERMLQAAVGRTGDEAVYALSEAYVQFVRVNPGLYDAALRAPDPKDPELHLAQNQIVDLVVKILSFYNMQDDKVLHTVRGLRSILHGFASIESVGGFGLPLDLDVTFRMMIDTFLAGIHAQMKQESHK
ncbi:TetR/AcrR family transcriptional regulator [Paenibacillus sp. URB8-2]|uniref:TetR/AcrR family transcriptional regulator n=1 Tax=Paenibacillus sp. URB8-2 TaxID=2741301 RepID=UPI0015BC7858|nr:TetR/AcrR family transcriptional regulator [Paenibacillus sp. URB8-2]BCG58527.1 TetR family transcriptional regulator [Paenibacillus sp. URB8-2]